MQFVDIMVTYIIPGIAALAAAFIVPPLRQWLQYKNLTQYVKIAVHAAEQIFGQGHGADKLKRVMAEIQSKFNLSDGDARRLIEAAVFEMNTISANGFYLE